MSCNHNELLYGQLVIFLFFSIYWLNIAFFFRLLNERSNEIWHIITKKEEMRWGKAKKEEEALLRQLGFPENKIKDLYDYDRENFNRDRIYGEKEDVTKEGFFNRYPVYDHIIIISVEDLLDHIEDTTLLFKLENADKVLLKILLLRFLGYEINEIAHDLNMSANAIRKRINRFRKKL